MFYDTLKNAWLAENFREKYWQNWQIHKIVKLSHIKYVWSYIVLRAKYVQLRYSLLTSAVLLQFHVIHIANWLMANVILEVWVRGEDKETFAFQTHSISASLAFRRGNRILLMCRLCCPHSEGNVHGPCMHFFCHRCRTTAPGMFFLIISMLSHSCYMRTEECHTPEECVSVYLVCVCVL